MAGTARKSARDRWNLDRQRTIAKAQAEATGVVHDLLADVLGPHILPAADAPLAEQLTAEIAREILRRLNEERDECTRTVADVDHQLARLEAR